jgi:hypothetical protein
MQLRVCDDQMERYLATFADQSQGRARPRRNGRGRRERRRNDPAFDVASAMFRMSGVDLTALEAIETQRMLLHQVLHDEPTAPPSLNDHMPRRRGGPGPWPGTRRRLPRATRGSWSNIWLKHIGPDGARPRGGRLNLGRSGPASRARVLPLNMGRAACSNPLRRAHDFSRNVDGLLRLLRLKTPDPNRDLLIHFNAGMPRSLLRLFDTTAVLRLSAFTRNFA